MKIIKLVNTFAIGLPIVLGLIGIVINDTAGNFICYALYSTMLTGFIQVVLGIILFCKDLKNKKLQLYLSLVALFFTLWYINMNLCYSDFLTYCLFPIPLLLAIYLSFIIYQKKTL